MIFFWCFKMKHKDKKINNISDLIKHLKKDTQNCEGPIWYRGQSNEKWNLISSFERSNNSASEKHILTIFKQNATLLLDHQKIKDDFDWLFLMQHYGVPTRLLDWSESPLVALYFSVNENYDEDGALWILLPIELNKTCNVVFSDPCEIPSFDYDYLNNYHPNTIALENSTKLYPVATIATRNSKRMQAQLGVFTIAHRAEAPIEEIGDKKHVWRYIIPKECKKDILDELKLIGFSKFQLFPELECIRDALNGGV